MDKDEIPMEDDSDMIEVSKETNYDQISFNTHRVLNEHKEIALNFPRYIKEALYGYTTGISDEDSVKDIADAFLAVEPLEEPITVFRGIDSTRDNVDLSIKNFISTSASIDVARDFQGRYCCLFVINVPAGSKVVYIPKEMHYEDDDEQEILLQGPATLNVSFYDDYRGLFVADYQNPSLKINIAKMARIRAEMEDIEQLNTVADMLGSTKGKVVTNEEVFSGLTRERASKFFEILMRELTPYPLEISERPVQKQSMMEMFVEGKRVYEWDIPKGVPFARISIILLFLLIRRYRDLVPKEFYDEFLSGNEFNEYKFFVFYCNKLKLSEYFVFDHLGAFRSGSLSYRIAFWFTIPMYTDSDYVTDFIKLLIRDRLNPMKERRIKLLNEISFRADLRIVIKRELALMKSLI